MEFPKITSAHNEIVKHAMRLRNRRDREREQLTVLEGYREISRAREYGLEILTCCFSPDWFLGCNEYGLLDALAASGARVVEVAGHLLAKMAYRDRPEGLIAIARMRRHALAGIPLRPDGLYLIAESVEKPGNLGSILRSADAAGADGLVVCDKCTDIYNPNVIRASTGALFAVPFAEASGTEAWEWLRANGIRILAATPHASLIYTEADMTGPVAIAVGTEQCGLSKLWLERSDIPVRIPMLGRIDSLNVAAAATILLYEAARQRRWRGRTAEREVEEK